jgi:hypothetical protein
MRVGESAQRIVLAGLAALIDVVILAGITFVDNGRGDPP